MRPDRRPSRRAFLTGAGASAGALALAGCDALSQSPGFRSVLYTGEDLTMLVQRALLAPSSMAKEFPASAISPDFKANGSTDPDSADYRALAANGFAEWRLEVGGLVERPASYSLAELRALPARSQITRHDCVEGWSCIGKWTGVQLATLLTAAGLKPDARYILFTCADELEKTLDGSGRYYETIDLEDAFHPQTILAYAMNDEPLPIAHGAPLRVRVERQLGYKMAKYLMRIDAIESFTDLGRGRGSFWADRGYDWYAGI
ncbi:MAG: molybdopterin-binding protein [Bauldia sp.]|nr:molybdopterin-binding protein [Bauldia sp.]